MKLEYEQLLENIQNKQYAPIILLGGEESFYVSRLTQIIQDNFFDDNSLIDFNFQVLYGKETSVSQIVDSAKQFPMMGNARLVIVREAQQISKWADFVAYAKNPQPQTVLVLSFMEGKKMDGKLAAYKEIVKNGFVFESTKIYENKLPAHVAKIVKERNIQIGTFEINLLITHIGNDLSRINNELTKLQAIIPEGGKITSKMIEEFTGISREHNIFELCSALLLRNSSKVFFITDYFINNPGKAKDLTLNPIFNTFYQLLQLHYSVDKSEMFMKKIGVFWTEYDTYKQALLNYPLSKVVNAIHLIRKYDAMSKGADGCQINKLELLRELTLKIMIV